MHARLLFVVVLIFASMFAKYKDPLLRKQEGEGGYQRGGWFLSLCSFDKLSSRLCSCCNRILYMGVNIICNFNFTYLKCIFLWDSCNSCVRNKYNRRCIDRVIEKMQYQSLRLDHGQELQGLWRFHWLHQSDAVSPESLDLSPL